MVKLPKLNLPKLGLPQKRFVVSSDYKRDAKDAGVVLSKMPIALKRHEKEYPENFIQPLELVEPRGYMARGKLFNQNEAGSKGFYAVQSSKKAALEKQISEPISPPKNGIFRNVGPNIYTGLIVQQNSRALIKVKPPEELTEQHKGYLLRSMRGHSDADIKKPLPAIKKLGEIEYIQSTDRRAGAGEKTVAALFEKYPDATFHLSSEYPAYRFWRSQGARLDKYESENAKMALSGKGKYMHGFVDMTLSKKDFDNAQEKKMINTLVSTPIPSAISPLNPRGSAVIFDIDDTLSDTKDRKHFVEADRDHQDWEKFYAGISHDPPIKPTMDKLKEEREHGHRVVFLSGRTDTVENRKNTKDWLAKQGVPFEDSDIVLRPVGNFDKADKFKEGKLNEISKEYNVLRAYDDDPTIREMFQQKGIKAIDPEELAPGFQPKPPVEEKSRSEQQIDVEVESLLNKEKKKD